jgi:hypothetical protein
MLSEDQERKARAAFEDSKRATHQRVLTTLRRGKNNGTKLTEDFAREGPRLERRSDGSYVDVHRRLDWEQWAQAWAACLEANKP